MASYDLFSVDLWQHTACCCGMLMYECFLEMQCSLVCCQDSNLVSSTSSVRQTLLGMLASISVGPSVGLVHAEFGSEPVVDLLSQQLGNGQ